MRTIKFRGKVADEPNEWVYGYLSSKDVIYQPKETENSKCCGAGTFKVIVETIGQYTGLHDKNGKEIYEGDILYYLIYEQCTRVGKVEYIDDMTGFFFVFGGKSKCIGSILEGVEVIGNIYDNPKLLEV